jgi:hypothetical protein
MKQILYGTPTDVVLRTKLMDSSATDGSGLTGLTVTSSGLIISTIKINEAIATSYTQAASTIENLTTIGLYETPSAGKCRFREVNATLHPGVYELHFANARFVSTESLIISLNGATNLAEQDFEVQIGNVQSEVNNAVTIGVNQDKTGYSLVGIPDMNLVSLSGTKVTGFDQFKATTTGLSVDLNADQSAVTIGTVTIAANMRGTDNALLAANINVTNGVIESNLISVSGSALNFDDFKADVNGLSTFNFSTEVVDGMLLSTIMQAPPAMLDGRFLITGPTVSPNVIWYKRDNATPFTTVTFSGTERTRI